LTAHLRFWQFSISKLNEKNKKNQKYLDKPKIYCIVKLYNLMLIIIDQNDSRPIYQQIADEIRFLIARGELTEDAPLPAVRQLASDLGVNLNTVATAYRELQADGLLTIKHGAGAVVASRTTTEKSVDNLRKPLRSALANMFLAGLSWAEIMNLVVDEMRGLLRETR
jgi:GntR family transcriptional regulator